MRAAQSFRPGKEDSRARAPLRLGHDLSLGRQTGTSEPACMFVSIRTDWKELARAHTALAIRRPALSCRYSLASPCDLSRDSLGRPRYCRWLAAAFSADDYCVLLRGGRHSRSLVLSFGRSRTFIAAATGRVSGGTRIFRDEQSPRAGRRGCRSLEQSSDGDCRADEAREIASPSICPSRRSRPLRFPATLSASAANTRPRMGGSLGSASRR